MTDLLQNSTRCLKNKFRFDELPNIKWNRKGVGLTGAKSILFRTAIGRTGQLFDRPMSQADAYRMIHEKCFLSFLQKFPSAPDGQQLSLSERRSNLLALGT